jgi:hypothetical protein
MRGFVHHVVLTVRNPEQCFPLYDSVLTALGYRLEQKDERGLARDASGRLEQTRCSSNLQR